MAGNRPAEGAEPPFLQVQTTTDSRTEAMELGRMRPSRPGWPPVPRSSGPVVSSYWWEGDLERAEEWLLSLKLPAARYQELADFLTQRHSYDEPEIVATAIVAGSRPT